ncbi:MAG TPA: hypothetical protein VJ772_08075 [Nitrososphaeraceae archaeon]|jgi:hypothetical protein|nr:hypothetical protein [Nitrososphaeraceae archaeon]
MDTKSAIFITLGYLLVMAIYNSSSNSDVGGMKSDNDITKGPIE